MTKPFIRTVRFDDSRRRVKYKVHGFWSDDYVSVSQYCDFRGVHWGDVSIMWSCGGADPAEPDRFFAAQCLAMAIADAVTVARLMSTTPDAPTPDPEMVRQCLEAYEAGETYTTEDMLADCRRRMQEQAAQTGGEDES